jgi:methyltransferase (TIGR00027 family)
MLRLSEQYNPRSAETTQYILVRIRYFDDWLANSLRGLHHQVVMIAAGLDTRPFRLKIPADTTFYELDQPAVLQLKSDLLAQNNCGPSCRSVPVSVDLKQDWIGPLKRAGFDPAKPSVWLAEGLFYYLQETDVRQLLQGISQNAAPGSLVGCDLVSDSFFRSPWSQKALENLAARGTPWLFGTDDPEQLFAEYGWSARAIQPGEEPANYGRWTSAVHPREQREVPRSFLLTGQKL